MPEFHSSRRTATCQVVTMGPTCLCCCHTCRPRGRRLSRAAGGQNGASDGVRAAEIFLPPLATALSYLVGVGHIRAAVAGVSHAIVVSVSLVYVGDSRAVVEKIRLACEEKHLHFSWIF